MCTYHELFKGISSLFPFTTILLLLSLGVCVCVCVCARVMNCFCGMVDRRKGLSPISSLDHCQRSSPSLIFDTPQAGFEPSQNLSSGLVEWSCAGIITSTTTRRLRVCVCDGCNSTNVYKICEIISTDQDSTISKKIQQNISQCEIEN